MDGGSKQGKKRGKKRIKRRIPCELLSADRRFTGIVLDVSADGMFVQTSQALPPGTAVRVVVQGTSSSEGFELDATVARAKRVPPQLLSAALGGIGLRVPNPPPAFIALQGAPEEEEEAPHAAPAASQAPPPVVAYAGPRFRVRLKIGSRSRVLVVEAPDLAAARRVALLKVGAGWEVLGIEPV